MKNEIRWLLQRKKVLITGNTGFKGSWLSLFLKRLGADVYGLSISGSRNSIYNLEKNKRFIIDIKDFANLNKIIHEIEPDIIFHIAANTTRFKAFITSLETFQTDAIGTINILESLRLGNFKSNLVVVISDKCDKKKKITENEELTGLDPYSTSKSMTKLAVNFLF